MNPGWSGEGWPGVASVAPVNVPLAFDTSAHATGNGTTTTPTFTTTKGSGQIVVAVFTNAANVVSVTATGLTFNRRSSKTWAEGTSWIVNEVWSAPYTSNFAGAVTVTLPDSSSITIDLVAVGGANTTAGVGSPPYDANTSLPSYSVNGFAGTQATGSTNNANNFVFGAMGLPGATGTATAPWLAVPGSGTNFELLEYQIATAVGSFTTASSSVSGAILDALMGQGTGGSGTAVGLITNFGNLNGAMWQIDAANVANQNANQSGAKPWCIQQIDSYTIRLENRSGDVWYNPNYDDTGNNRNELAFVNLNGSTTTFPQDVEARLSYYLTFEAGATNIAGFCDIAQIHASVNSPPSPFYLNFDTTDQLSVVIQTPSISYQKVGQTASPLTRGQTYHIEAKVMMNPVGGGYARVWVDGVQIANYSGAIGATGSTYFWKFGIYRNEVSQTLAATFRNISIGFG